MPQGNAPGKAFGPVASGSSSAAASNKNLKKDDLPEIDALDALQMVLDIAGMVPGFGIGADLLNSAISLGRGDFLGSLLSAAGAIEGIGQGVTAAKVAKNSSRYMDAIKVVEAKYPGLASKLHLDKAKAWLNDLTGGKPKVSTQSQSGARGKVGGKSQGGARGTGKGDGAPGGGGQSGGGKGGGGGKDGGGNDTSPKNDSGGRFHGKPPAKGSGHAKDRHGPNRDKKKYPDDKKSHFDSDSDIDRVIRESDQHPAKTAKNGNKVTVFDSSVEGTAVDAAAGTSSRTTTMTVVTKPDGSVITAHPGTPHNWNIPGAYN